MKIYCIREKYSEDLIRTIPWEGSENHLARALAMELENPESIFGKWPDDFIIYPAFTPGKTIPFDALNSDTDDIQTLRGFCADYINADGGDVDA